MCHPSVTFPMRLEHSEGGTGRRPTLSPLRISQPLSGSAFDRAVASLPRVGVVGKSERGDELRLEWHYQNSAH